MLQSYEDADTHIGLCFSGVGEWEPARQGDWNGARVSTYLSWEGARERHPGREGGGGGEVEEWER